LQGELSDQAIHKQQMKITANEEYGLRVILQLYKITNAKSKGIATGTLATLNEIAQAEQISSDYVAQLLLKLRRGNLVESVRGKKGGYHLQKAAKEITLFEVMQALSDEAFAEDFCANHAGHGLSCAHSSECTIRPVWATISSMVNNYFKSITLDQLLNSESSLGDSLKELSLN